LEQKNFWQLKVIDEPLDIYLEIPHLAYAEIKKEDSKALLFTHPIDKKNNRSFDIPVAMNLYGSYERTELLFGRGVESVASEIEKLLHMKPPSTLKDKLSMLGDLFSLKSVFPKRLKAEGECQQVKYLDGDVDLYKLPVLTTWEQDGGPFITMEPRYVPAAGL